MLSWWKGALIAKEVIEEAVEVAVKEHNVEFRYLSEKEAHTAIRPVCLSDCSS